MRFALFAGTRPEVIKLRPVWRALSNWCIDLEFVLIEQQPDLLKDALPDIPHTRIALTRTTGTLPELFREITAALTSFPFPAFDGVIVQGDTSTAAAVALVARYAGTPVAHVEAGLRTYRPQPFPEELNRRVIAQTASWHFAPTSRACANLGAEHIDPAQVWVTGNTGIDALYDVLRHGGGTLQRIADVLHGQHERQLILVTCHRRENARRLTALAGAIEQLSAERYFVVWPRHPNYTGTPGLIAYEAAAAQDHVQGTDPLDHRELVQLLSRSHLVITDSGGIIEEAAELERPCLILRDETERPEALDEGCVLVPREQMTSLGSLIENFTAKLQPRTSRGCFGDGHAGDAIADVLVTARASG